MTWGQELAIALRQCNASLRNRDGFEDEQPSLFPFGRKVKSALRDVWKEAAADVFDIGYALSFNHYLYSSSVLTDPLKRLRALTDSQRR